MRRRLSVVIAALSVAALARAEPVVYEWFEYTGRDAVFEQPLPAGHFRNPILSGFHPDPSITRAGQRFYLVHSTFAYFPGIPVFESTDLVHWKQIGSVIDRPSQLDFSKLGVSRGVFAPSIEHRDGTFYVFNTHVDGGGNFVVTAKNPAGPWSDPVWLPELAGGIDPSMFVDDDGRAYVLNNGPPAGAPRYDGHRAIWIQEFDRAALRLQGPRKVLIDGGVDPGKQPIWIEGPHIYKRQGWYYLSCAEGGTGPQHSQVVLRARSPRGPFEPHAGNPILTQRDLAPDRTNPVTNAGHADLVEAPDGTWWATFLATRTYEGVHYNTGRETFLLPVTWHDGWPLILERDRAIPRVVRGPKFMQARTQAPLSGNFTWRDEFDTSALDKAWLQLRTSQQKWFDLRRVAGALSIDPQVARLGDTATPSFLARRQQHLVFDATTALRVPGATGIAAGLAAFQNESHWYFLGTRRTEHGVGIFLEKQSKAGLETIATATLPNVAQLKLRISGDARAYTFSYEAGDGWRMLKERDDGSILSTEVAGGFVGATVGPYAREEPAYRDENRSFEARAADLVARMTLEEKIAQLGNNAPAIARLGMPRYEWWNEALHGVARAGAATVFPQAIGLAATFDRELLHEIAVAISDEARAKHHEFARRGLRGRYQGLTFWSPNINIFRDPRWGRGQETYGEDPWLTARMGVAFVQGLQGDDPRYRKVDATAKHFAVHSGPEADRHHFDVRPSEQDLYDTYLPAFEALVREGRVAAVMGAYNRVYGESASASSLLLQKILRDRWGFQGYVVSDCDSIEDIYKHHKIVSTAAEAAALGVKRGCDLDCGKTYDALLPAAQQGLIDEVEIDAAVRRLMLTRMQLGMFDPPERVRWAQIPYSVNQSAAHDALARRAAQSSIVLLKNDGVLPLSRDIKTLAVIGPTADEIMSLLGNYYGTPAEPVTILRGIRDAVGAGTRVLYSRGTDLVEGREEPRAAPLIDATYLRPVCGVFAARLARRVLSRPRAVRRTGDDACRRAHRVSLGSRRTDRRCSRARRAVQPERAGGGRLQRALDRSVVASRFGPLRNRSRRQRRLSPVPRWPRSAERLGGERARAQRERVRRPAGGQGIRAAVGILRGHSRRRGAPGVASAGRETAVRRSARYGAGRRCSRIRRRIDRRRRRRGNEGELSGLRRRRPHGSAPAGQPAQASRSAACNGQACRTRAHDGLGTRRRLGAGKAASDSSRVVSGAARRFCSRRCLVR